MGHRGRHPAAARGRHGNATACGPAPRPLARGAAAGSGRDNPRKCPRGAADRSRRRRLKTPSLRLCEGRRCRTGHGRYLVPVEVHSKAAGETGQEGGEGLKGRTGQSEEGPSAEERGVCPRVCRERHPQEERRCQLASHGVTRGRGGLQGADGYDHERGDQEHGTGDQGPGQGTGQHGPAEGVCGGGQVRAADAEPGCAHVGDGGLHELGHHAEHTARAGGQPHCADCRGERPGGAGPAQPAARGRLCSGRELCAQPGGPAVPQAGRPAELGERPHPTALPSADLQPRPHCSPHLPGWGADLFSSPGGG